MNAEFELHVSKCKEDFKKFAESHKYLLKHVKKWEQVNVNGEIIKINPKPLGTIIVFFDGEGLRVGFSKVHPTDRYNRHIGIMKAIKNCYGDVDRNVPKAFQIPITKMVDFAQSEKGHEILIDDEPKIDWDNR